MIILEYYKRLYATKSINLEGIDKFLETYNLSRLNHEVLKNLSRLINSEKIETIIIHSPQKIKVQDQMISLVNSTKFDFYPSQTLCKN